MLLLQSDLDSAGCNKNQPGKPAPPVTRGDRHSQPQQNHSEKDRIPAKPEQSVVDEERGISASDANPPCTPHLMLGNDDNDPASGCDESSDSGKNRSQPTGRPYACERKQANAQCKDNAGRALQSACASKGPDIVPGSTAQNQASCYRRGEDNHKGHKGNEV